MNSPIFAVIALLALGACSDQTKTEGEIKALQQRVTLLEQRVATPIAVAPVAQKSFALDVNWMVPGQPPQRTVTKFPNQATCERARADTIAQEDQLKMDAISENEAERKSGFISAPSWAHATAICEEQ